MRRITFLYYLIGFFIIQSCVSPDPNPELDQEKTLSPIVLHVNNDSLVSINGLEINLSELDSHLDQFSPNAGYSSHVTIKPDFSVKMSTMYNIEEVLASKSVQEITYLSNGKSVKMRRVLEAANQIKFDLTKDDKLIFGNIQINSDEELLSLIQSLTEGISKPLIVINPQTGSGYNAYLVAKDRVRVLLLKHDSNIELGEGSYDHYERIE
jgi:biopolymer transport protein ExbD